MRSPRLNSATKKKLHISEPTLIREPLVNSISWHQVFILPWLPLQHQMVRFLYVRYFPANFWRNTQWCASLVMSWRRLPASEGNRSDVCFSPSFICGSHPSLLQRLWHAIRRYSWSSWLRRRLKAQPIWTLFPRRCLFWIIILWARQTLLISLTPALVSARYTPPLPLPSSRSPHFFLYSPRLYFKDDEAIVLLTPLKLNLQQKEVAASSQGGDGACVRVGDLFFFRGVKGARSQSDANPHSTAGPTPPAEVRAQIKG